MNKIINPCTVEGKQAYCRVYTEEKVCVPCWTVAQTL